MAMPGSDYLFNLSIVAMTFAAVSVLVMLIRQTMGGRLAKFDVYLIVAFVSVGCVLAVDAMLPPLISTFEPSAGVLWAVSSGLAAVLLGSCVAVLVTLRRRVSPAPMPRWAVAVFGLHGADALLLAVNAVVPALQGVRLFATALTLSLAVFMWSFLRRLVSLLGDKPGEDWDPRAQP